MYLTRLALCVSLALPLALPVSGQSAERLNRKQAEELTGRILDLFEATQIVLPEVARASAPLRENFRQGVLTLRASARGDHTEVLYMMLTNAKAYLQLSDTLSPAAGFSADVSRQLAQLRTEVQGLESHFRATLRYREEQVLGSDRDNLRRYAEQNSLAGPPDPNQLRVVFLGDSITDAWRLNQYFGVRDYLNRGISGQITGQMLGRMKADVIDLRANVVVVLGGTNDLARSVPDATIRNNLETIGMLAEAAGISPVLASILPVNDHAKDADPRFLRTTLRPPARISQLNFWLKELCRSKGWVYLDYFSPMADRDGLLRPELADDGLHPNAEGYKVMTPLAIRAIEMARNRASSRRRGR